MILVLLGQGCCRGPAKLGIYLLVVNVHYITFLKGSNSRVYITKYSIILLTRVSSIDDVVRIGHGIIGEAIMRKVDLPNSFLYPADEAGQRAETV
jgi:hypothetical protein